MQTGRAISLKILFGLILVLFPQWGEALDDNSYLPELARAALYREQDFGTVRKVDQIPEGVLAALRKFEGVTIKIVDPGQPFQKKDLVQSDRYPCKQLQFAAVSKNYVLIHYATGDDDIQYYFILFKRSEKSFKFDWIGYGPRCKNISEFIECIRSNRLNPNGHLYIF